MSETERSMLDRLRVRYGKLSRNGDWVGRQYVVAEHVPLGLSLESKRIADAVVLDTRSAPYRELTEAEQADARALWGKRQSIHGFEVKISRSDWLTGLNTPEKAASWSRYCHYFWLVAAHKSIVRNDLPEAWGLLVPHGRSLRVVVSPVRKGIDPMPLETMVSLVRAVQRTEVAMAAAKLGAT